MASLFAQNCFKCREFIGKYLDYQSPFKEMLVYHGVGAGKTVSVINVYNILYNYNPKWNIFLLMPAALHDDPWLKDLKNWLTKENYEDRFKNIIFIHYDSPFADRDFLEKVKMCIIILVLKKVKERKLFMIIFNKKKKKILMLELCYYQLLLQ